MLLQTERLRVNVAEPHQFPNTTSRFDHAGFVTSVLLDGRYEFCTGEPTNLVHPSTGGVGLCNEYLFPSACEQARAGERFAKFGIGLLLKPDEEPFCFYRKYDVDYYPVSWTANERQIVFSTAPVLCNGYAVAQHKTLLAEENRLVMRVVLCNRGEKPLEMREFCHNFVTLEHQPIGPAYCLDMPMLKDRGTKIEKGTIRGNGRGFTFAAYNPEAALVNVGADEIEDADSFAWRLRHKESPVSILASVDFKPDGIDLWSIDHIVSVETFRAISLLPGETATWTRQWVFSDERDTAHE